MMSTRTVHVVLYRPQKRLTDTIWLSKERFAYCCQDGAVHVGDILSDKLLAYRHEVYWSEFSAQNFVCFFFLCCGFAFIEDIVNRDGCNRSDATAALTCWPPALGMVESRWATNDGPIFSVTGRRSGPIFNRSISWNQVFSLPPDEDTYREFDDLVPCMDWCSRTSGSRWSSLMAW